MLPTEFGLQCSLFSVIRVLMEHECCWSFAGTCFWISWCRAFQTNGMGSGGICRIVCNAFVWVGVDWRLQVIGPVCSRSSKNLGEFSGTTCCSSRLSSSLPGSGTTIVRIVVTTVTSRIVGWCYFSRMKESHSLDGC